MKCLYFHGCLRRLRPAFARKPTPRSSDASSPFGAGSSVICASAVNHSTLSSSNSSSNNVSSNETDEAQQLPEHINFTTRHLLRREHVGSRRLRSRSSMSPEEEQQLFKKLRPVDPTDPYTHDRPFRREIMMVGSMSRQGLGAIQVSVDVPVKRFFDLFGDHEMKRCKLCNETFVTWHIHSSGIPHQGREGVVLELVRPFCGTPEEQLERWNYRLWKSREYDRIPELSHPNPHIRKRRLQYLLRFLQDREVLVDVFNIGTDVHAARTFEFERLEFVGDNVAKFVLNNIMSLVFPVRDGGIRGRLSQLQFVMDGNDGLARGYDFLELQDFTRSNRVVSKFKSDVVETIFGELQFFLWTTQADVDTQPLTFPFSKDIYTLRAIVQHVLYEFGSVIFMYHVEYIAGMLQRIVRENQLQYIKADPSLQHMQGVMEKSGGGRSRMRDDDDEGYYTRSGGTNYNSRGGGVYGFSVPTRKLMKTRVARAQLHGSSSALYHEASNYDNFKRVVPIGGLLPRPFTRAQLAVIPNHMPHLQRDETLTQAVRDGAEVWAPQLRQGLAGKGNGDGAPHEASTSVVASDPYRLTRTPTTKPSAPSSKTLSIPRLKDEELIAELL